MIKHTVFVFGITGIRKRFSVQGTLDIVFGDDSDFEKMESDNEIKEEIEQNVAGIDNIEE